MHISISTVLTLAIVSFLSGGCADGNGRTAAVSGVMACDSLPQSVKHLVEAISDNDSLKFASLVSYPLQRPYPLKDIPGEKEMRGYYKVMVDDSLRNVVTSSGPSYWERYGWRGWSLRDGDYVWVSDSVYDVPYVSHAERLALDSLVNREMGSLDASLRKGWKPVECLVSADGRSVFRIDSCKDRKGALVFRFAAYSDGADLKGLPTMVMTGRKVTEGTAATTTYYFDSADGSKLIYDADVADGSNPELVFVSPEGEERAVPVAAAYWLDLLKK